MDMTTMLDWCSSYGLAIVLCICMLIFIFKMIGRDRDEALQREDKLTTANIKSAEALEKVADTIEKTNETNYALSETNRLLVEKMEDKLTSIDGKLDKLIDKN